MLRLASGRAQSGFHRVGTAVARRGVARQRRHAIDTLRCVYRGGGGFSNPQPRRGHRGCRRIRWQASPWYSFATIGARAPTLSLSFATPFAPDVEDRPELAVLYNVGTTPTIL